MSDNTRSLAAAEELLTEFMRQPAGTIPSLTWIAKVDAYLALPAAAPDAGLREALEKLLVACSINGVPERGAKAPAYSDLMDAVIALAQGDGNGEAQR